jgi:archaeal type IV pilus assembly protein PilA
MRVSKKTLSEHAVSPVVGVMLMLVVTIIIAAVVSAFSGGLAGTQQKAPTAVLDVHIHALENQGAMAPYGNGYYTSTMTISEVSGEALPTKDLKITTSFTNKTGSVLTGSLSGETKVAGNDTWTSYTSSQYSGVLYLNDKNRFKDGTIQTSGGSGAWFGNASAIIQAGDTLTTPAQFCGNYDDNEGPTVPHKNPGVNYLLGFDTTDSIHGFTTGSTVEVKIIHIPSGKMIYNKEVNVE